MENPAAWGEAERVVQRALDDYHAVTASGLTGTSLAKRITDALREAGPAARRATAPASLGNAPAPSAVPPLAPQDPAAAS